MEKEHTECVPCLSAAASEQLCPVSVAYNSGVPSDASLRSAHNVSIKTSTAGNRPPKFRVKSGRGIAKETREDRTKRLFRHYTVGSYDNFTSHRSWWSGEVSDDWKKANATPVFRKGKEESVGNPRLVSLTLTPGKVMKQLTLETLSEHMKGKVVMGSSQPGFVKGKSCLSMLIALCSEVTSLLGEGRAVDVVCLGFSKAFDTFSCKALIEELTKYGYMGGE
ncbi:hypothetical protein QYF61_013769 [Mycteria americana]|uniref:Reverse transcriptase domain-containing protein n=1 Tax=Mycteria americana TaxID=33587 RepID=A0AAN7S734_MYCAM|nr:hypothetical protein QYF61_013769 [Mycteria americana]